MNAIGNMHEVRFPNIYILLNIIYYILPLIITIVLVIKAVGFSNKFAMHYGDIIFYFFYFLLFQTKTFITTWLKRWNEKHKKIELISRFKDA